MKVERPGVEVTS